MITTASILLAALCALTASAATYRRAYKRGVEVGRASLTTGTPPASWLIKHRDADELIRQAKSDRAHLLNHVDERTIRIIEARFQTHLPAFQQRGDGYNTLDAMRRDAGREVTLYLRQQLELAAKEAKD